MNKIGEEDKKRKEEGMEDGSRKERGIILNSVVFRTKRYIFFVNDLSIFLGKFR